MKKLITLFLVIAMSVTMFTGTAVFATSDEGLDANTYVCSDSDLVKAAKIVDNSNEQIDHLVEVAKSQKDPDLSLLIEKTSNIAMKAIEKCADLGIVVKCELIPVEINGHVIYIDPLRIIPR